jgi:hypothetical protein
VSQLVQGVYANYLLFFDQYVTLVKGLHVEQFIFVPLLHGFNNSSVSSAVPYSYLLFSMCNAYTEIGLLFLMYRVCSLCIVAIAFPDCPTYELLQALHFSLFIPLEFVLVLIILSVRC